MSGGAKPAAKKGPAKDTKKLAFVDAIKISDLPKPGNSVKILSALFVLVCLIPFRTSVNT